MIKIISVCINFNYNYLQIIAVIFSSCFFHIFSSFEANDSSSCLRVKNFQSNIFEMRLTVGKFQKFNF